MEEALFSDPTVVVPFALGEVAVLATESADVNGGDGADALVRGEGDTVGGWK